MPTLSTRPHRLSLCFLRGHRNRFTLHTQYCGIRTILRVCLKWKDALNRSFPVVALSAWEGTGGNRGCAGRDGSVPAAATIVCRPSTLEVLDPPESTRSWLSGGSIDGSIVPSVHLACGVVVTAAESESALVLVRRGSRKSRATGRGGSCDRRLRGRECVAPRRRYA